MKKRNTRHRLETLRRRFRQRLEESLEPPPPLSPEVHALKIATILEVLKKKKITEEMARPILYAYETEYDLISDGLSVPWFLAWVPGLKPKWQFMGEWEPHPLGTGHDLLYKYHGLPNDLRTRSQCDKWLLLMMDYWGYGTLDDVYYRRLNRWGGFAWEKHRDYDFTDHPRYGRPPVALATHPAEGEEGRDQGSLPLSSQTEGDPDAHPDHTD